MRIVVGAVAATLALSGSLPAGAFETDPGGGMTLATRPTAGALYAGKWAGSTYCLRIVWVRGQKMKYQSNVTTGIVTKRGPNLWGRRSGEYGFFNLRFSRGEVTVGDEGVGFGTLFKMTPSGFKARCS